MMAKLRRARISWLRGRFLHLIGAADETANKAVSMYNEAEKIGERIKQLEAQEMLSENARQLALEL